jgi:hypothetical protein
MLIFASDVWVQGTIDIKPLQILYLSLTVYVGGKLFKLGQDPSKCTQNVLQCRMVVLSPVWQELLKR